jgi:hypothetical protein
MVATIAKKAYLDGHLSGATVRAILLEEDPTAIATVTADAGTDVITATGHDYLNGTRVKFTTTGTLPAGLNTSTTYRVVQVSGATFKVALEANYSKTARTASGVVDITDTGSGTHSVTEQAFDESLDSDVDVYVRHEAATYQGSGRQSSSALPAATISGTTASIAQQTFVFTPTTGTVTFRYCLFIKGGSGTLGNTTGDVLGVRDEGTTKTLTTGSSYTATFTPSYS